MKSKLTYLLIFTTVIIIGCGTGNTNKKKIVADTTAAKVAVIADSLQHDTIALNETFNQEDLPINEYLTDQLKPIRANFKRINSITNWTTVKTKDIWESTEGGEAKFYYLKGQLEKITARHYGETFQQLTEYYLFNGKLSFVFERTYKYNRLIYHDSAAMKEMNDTVTFDFEKSRITEDRSYFENGILLHQLNNEDCGSPFAKDYLLGEQKRINSDSERLIKAGAAK